MNDLWLSPGEIRGSIVAPPSKSYTHRAVVAGVLTHRRHEIRNPLLADDTLRTLEGARSLGTIVERRAGSWLLTPRSGTGRRHATIDCGASGTTLRLLAGLASLESFPVTLRGSRRLSVRPFRDLARTLASGGVQVSLPRGRPALPATLRGPLGAGDFSVPVAESSQFLSSLLLVLPTLPGNSTIHTVGAPVSAPYVEATLAVLRAHGVVARRGPSRFDIPGPQTFRARGMRVPGDASSAAYLWAAAAVTGGRVRVGGLSDQWPQADRLILDLLKAAGARVSRASGSATVEGPAALGFDAELTDAPDLYLLCGAIASSIPSTSRLRGAPHLRLKESDRRAATAHLCRALGARVRLRPWGLEVRGTSQTRPVKVRDDDHRVVMSACVGALAARGRSRIGVAGAVRKSYPGFWRDLRSLGAEVGSR